MSSPGDPASSATRSSFEQFYEESQNWGKQAELEIESKMGQIEKDLKAIDQVFLKEMRKKSGLSYGQQKSLLSECLKNGKISFETKSRIRKECFARAERQKTRSSYGRPGGKAGDPTGEIPLSKPNYLTMKLWKNWNLILFKFKSIINKAVLG